jgi:uncharacterized protein
MRIEQRSQQLQDVMKKDQSSSTKHSQFGHMVQQSGKGLLKETLQQLMNKVEEQGKVLGKRRTIDDLISYKKLVQQFLQEASNGINLLEEHSHNRHKTYKVLRAVDEKLLELNKEVLDKEDDGVKLLAVVGEVKGLLVNLYM